MVNAAGTSNIVDPFEFRCVLGGIVRGVCLVTVHDARSGQLALTANSFASVSLAPSLSSKLESL